jgi:hypothetical protein
LTLRGHRRAGTKSDEARFSPLAPIALLQDAVDYLLTVKADLTTRFAIEASFMMSNQFGGSKWARIIGAIRSNSLKILHLKRI